MARAASSSSPPRLTVEDWLGAALDILAEEGLAGVKIDRLCQRLGVTKGSFYWHFEDIGAFLQIVAARWAETREQTRRSYDELAGAEPRERLLRMMEMLVDPAQWRLERAMREWARADADVRERVEDYDRWVFGVVRTALGDLGFERAEAELRAQALFYLGIGVLHGGQVGKPQSARGRERLIEILTS